MVGFYRPLVVLVVGLSESEVTAILRGKRVAVAPKDIKEVQNYHAALDDAEQLAADPRPLKLADMCDVHRLVTEGTIQEKFCGQIRTIPVSIVNAATGDNKGADAQRNLDSWMGLAHRSGQAFLVGRDLA